MGGFYDSLHVAPPQGVGLAGGVAASDGLSGQPRQQQADLEVAQTQQRVSTAVQEAPTGHATEVQVLGVDCEGLGFVGAVAVYAEVGVEGECLGDGQALHECPACAVGEGERLVGVVGQHRLGSL